MMIPGAFHFNGILSDYVCQTCMHPGLHKNFRVLESEALGTFQTVPDVNMDIFIHFPYMGFTSLSYIKFLSDSGGDIDATVKNVF